MNRKTINLNKRLGTYSYRLRKPRRLKTMTICISTICEISQASRIVFCADRLVTDANGLTFEQGKPKIDFIYDNCLVMSAGRGAESDQIIATVQRIIDEKFKKDKCPKIMDVAKIFQEELQGLRISTIENELLKARGLTIKEFYNNIKNFPDWLGIMLDNQISGFDFGVGFLIFGFDIDQKNKSVMAHLYKMDEKGNYILLDSIGFGIIGIGDIMSLPEITRETYSPNNSLSDALVRTFWAKKSAERVVSVGNKTTDIGFMWVELSDDGSLVVKHTLIGEEFKEELSDSFNKQSDKIREITDEIHTNIDDILSGKKSQSLELKQ